MKGKPSIAIVGAGSLAMALAPALREDGYAIEEVVSRDAPQSRRRASALARRVGARPATMATAGFKADVVWLCVSDRAIRECAEAVAARFSAEETQRPPTRANSTRSLGMTKSNADPSARAKRTRSLGMTTPRYVFHSSGALTSDELAAVRERGAVVASVHPMMTFVRSSAPSLQGVGFALEGDAAAVRAARVIVRDLGGHAFTIRRETKPLYHAWGAFGSPVLIMELALAERVARASGIAAKEARRTIEPIVRKTIDNYFAHGPAAAFSGPLVRGDVETVRRHLKQLARVPGAQQVYRALARTALANLPVERRKEMENVLKEGF